MNARQATQETIPELDTVSIAEGPTPPPERDWFALRKQRIDEHFQESLDDRDARTAIMGTVGADLMLLQLQVGEALRDILGPGHVAPELLSRNHTGIEMLLKLSKLVTQLAQLQRKMRLESASSHPPEELSEENGI